eukprot:Clim_evm26s6 gene=Clim_evmTU26s6
MPHKDDSGMDEYLNRFPESQKRDPYFQYTFAENAEGANVPIAYLDYQFIDQCKDGRTLEKIVKVLRSGKEGSYPHLLEHALCKLRDLNPRSKLLIDPKKTPEALVGETREEIVSDLASFTQRMKDLDQGLAAQNGSVVQPSIPIRGTVPVGETLTESDVIKPKEAQPKRKAERIKGGVFQAWDLYDVEAELRRIDEEESYGTSTEYKEQRSGYAEILETHGGLKKEDIQHLDAVELEHFSVLEKDKGNEYFKDNEYQDSMLHYTRSLAYKESVAALNNRALVFIKTKFYRAAELDTSRVLQLDSKNIKGHVRRGLSRSQLGKYQEAIMDLTEALTLDPKNAFAQRLLDDAKADLKKKGESLGTVSENEKKTKGKKKAKNIRIVEVEDDEDDKDNLPAATTSATGHATPAPTAKPALVQQKTPSEDEEVVPAAIFEKAAKLKEKGNEAFRAGDLAKALSIYTGAISDLSEYPTVAVTMINNRAVVFMKLGRFQECLADLGRSLTIKADDVKTLLRKANALESMKLFDDAIATYKEILLIEPTNAYAAQTLEKLIVAKEVTVEKTNPTVQDKIKPDQDKTKLSYDQWMNLGRTAIHTKDYSDAYHCFTEALKVKPTDLPAHNNRSLCHLKTQRFRLCREDANTVLRTDPRNVKALYRRALAQRGLFEFSAAERDLDTLLSIEPQNASAKAELNDLQKALLASKNQSSGIMEIDDEHEQSDVPYAPMSAALRNRINSDHGVQSSESEAGAHPAKTGPVKPSTTAASVPKTVEVADKMLKFFVNNPPKTAAEFINMYRSLKKNPISLARGLKAIVDAQNADGSTHPDLSVLTSGCVDANLIEDMIKAASQGSVLSQSDVSGLFSDLTGAPRFKLATKLVSKDSKANLATLLDTAITDDALKLADLKTAYGC